MTKRTLILLLASVLVTSCAAPDKPVAKAEKIDEVLHIYPDGRMVLNGRIMNKEDVVIYEDGRGGERAAVKLVIPRHPDVYRDTITVERQVVEVPVERKQ